MIIIELTHADLKKALTMDLTLTGGIGTMKTSTGQTIRIIADNHPQALALRLHQGAKGGKVDIPAMTLNIPWSTKKC